MPRRVDDFKQPELAPTAGDLGREAYQAHKNDQPGTDHAHRGDQTGPGPIWRAPEPANPPPGQDREDAAKVKLGEDPKFHHGKQGYR